MAKAPLLESLENAGFTMEVLERSAGRVYTYLLSLIINAPAVVERALAPWEYKSIQQLAEESFCNSSPSWFLVLSRDASKQSPEHRFFQVAEDKFSEEVRTWLYYLSEGLLLFVKDGENFRLATNDDADFRFVLELLQQGGIMNHHEAPKWAKNLFISHKAYEAYAMFWHDLSDRQSYEEVKRIRAAAVRLLYEGKLLDEQRPIATRRAPIITDDQPTASIPSFENTKAANTASKLIAALAIAFLGGRDKLAFPRAASAEISVDLQKFGISISDKTIEKYITKGLEHLD